MIALPPRERLLQWIFWIAGGLAVLAALAVVVLPHGGVDRMAGAALPFGVGAAALAGLAFGRGLERWLVLILYTIAALAITYAVMIVASVPLRIAVLGTCPPGPVICPPGFEQPLTGGENLALELAVGLGIVAVLITLAALEVQFQPRLRLFGRPGTQPEALAPPPAMKPSAIVQKAPGAPAPPPVMRPSAIVKNRPRPEAPAPPPVMRPSAIVKKAPEPEAPAVKPSTIDQEPARDDQPI